MSNPYIVKPLDLSADGLHRVELLLKAAFPDAKHLTASYFDWQYNANPAGPAVGFNAWRGDDLAAHYVTIPVEYRVGDGRTTGVLSLNTATHPAHQGRKLFTMLAERTYEEAARRGQSFVVGVANANSTPGFVKKLGFQEVARLDARLTLGSSAAGDSEPKEFERHWDRPALAWRLANPAIRYGRSLRRGRVHVEAATAYLPIRADLGDFEQDLVPGTAWSAALGPRPISLWLGLDDSRRWSTLLSWHVPKRFRRSPLNLIFKSLDGRLPRLERASIRFRALDFDPY